MTKLPLGRVISSPGQFFKKGPRWWHKPKKPCHHLGPHKIKFSTGKKIGGLPLNIFDKNIDLCEKGDESSKYPLWRYYLGIFVANCTSKSDPENKGHGKPGTVTTGMIWPETVQCLKFCLCGPQLKDVMAKEDDLVPANHHLSFLHAQTGNHLLQHAPVSLE